MRFIDDNVVPRPDTRYGVSKVFGEAVGRLYADKYGLSVACLRIGTFRTPERPIDSRQLLTWISHRDMVQLVRRCIDYPHYHFIIVYTLTSRGLERVVAALDIQRQDLVPWGFYGSAGEMRDAVDTLHSFFHRRDVADVGGDELFSALGFAQRRNVEVANQRIGATQTLPQCRSDLPCCAGDQYAFHVKSLVARYGTATKAAFVGANIGLRRGF